VLQCRGVSVQARHLRSVRRKLKGRTKLDAARSDTYKGHTARGAANMTVLGGGGVLLKHCKGVRASNMLPRASRNYYLELGNIL
jgi:hypothetical protein